jgi:glutaredoxin
MRSVIFAVMLGAACTAAAQMYRWTDDKGRVHVTDIPPPPAAAKDLQKQKVTISGAVAPQPARLPYAVQLAAKTFPVTLYTARECEPCGEARNLLNSRGVPFREVLVVDETQQAELKKVAGALAVPSVIVGSNVQKGFEESAYHSLLDIAGYPKTGTVPVRTQAEPQPAAPPAEPEVRPAEETADAASGPYVPGSSATGIRTRK